MSVVKCANCGREYETVPYAPEHGLVKIIEPHYAAQPGMPAPVYSVQHVNALQCVVITCRGKLEPAR
jgi:hypothetical protein